MAVKKGRAVASHPNSYRAGVVSRRAGPAAGHRGCARTARRRRGESRHRPERLTTTQGPARGCATGEASEIRDGEDGQDDENQADQGQRTLRTANEGEQGKQDPSKTPDSQLRVRRAVAAKTSPTSSVAMAGRATAGARTGPAGLVAARALRTPVSSDVLIWFTHRGLSCPCVTQTSVCVTAPFTPRPAKLLRNSWPFPTPDSGV